jgi:protein-L-isoaspartate(D-aspartate) O-methyltransferase
MMDQRDEFGGERMAMVDRQLRARGIRDERLLDAFAAIPREQFVDPELASAAYADGPLPIGFGQTISQPYIVALMLEAASINAAAKVLEVGAGSGYAAAILGRLARFVIAVERVPQLAAAARDRLARLGFDNVEVVEGDGTLGWPAAAPFDAILAAACGRNVPQSLIAQVAPGGRLVMPVGDRGGAQQLIKLTKAANGSITQETLGGVRFVPLIGAE